MKLNRFLEAMERIAPRALALEFDNPGLLVDPDHDEINRVLVALDCSTAVANEAADWGADLVLTHHPLFFHPVSRMAYSSPPRQTRKSRCSDRALTTDTPTPCRPPANR